MSLAQPIGHRDALIAERKAILANVAPRHRWRILGVKRRAILPPVTHAITVDCSRPEERRVEVVIARPPRPKIKPPAPSRVTIVPRAATLRILAAVADAFGVTVGDLCSPSRRRPYSWPRFAAMDLLYAQPGWSTVMVGKQIGGRDHTTVLAGIKRAKGLRATFPDYRHRYEAAHIALNGGMC